MSVAQKLTSVSMGKIKKYLAEVLLRMMWFMNKLIVGGFFFFLSFYKYWLCFFAER